MKTIEQNLKIYNKKKRIIKKEIENLDKATILSNLWDILYKYEQKYSSRNSLDLLFITLKNIDKKNLLKILAEIKTRLD